MATQVTNQPAAAGPVVGSRTAFTALMNVKPGHEKIVRELISADQGKPELEAALREIGTLHEFRWAMLDDDRRVTFASSFDGEWYTYIQDFASTQIGQVIDRNLQHCEGWVGIQDPTAADWLLDHAIPAIMYDCAYPEPSVKEVRKALAVQKAFEQVLDDPDAAEALQHPALKPLLDQAAD